MGALLFSFFFLFLFILFTRRGPSPGLSKWVPYYFSECNKKKKKKKKKCILRTGMWGSGRVCVACTQRESEPLRLRVAT